MDIPTADITGCRAAHGRLRVAVSALTDDVVRQPSLLPGWTVGHVVTHLARNADSVIRRLRGAARGEIADQYAGGAPARAAAIQAGAARTAQALASDAVRASEDVDAAFASFPSEGWGRMSRSVSGQLQPVGLLPFRRWREVDVHLVDLGLEPTASGWPEELAERWLPELLPRLSERADPRALLAWALRRGPAPELDPW